MTAQSKSRSLERMEDLVSLCARRGFVFQSSEIYGGINGFWDYGPLGVELKNSLKEIWWQRVVRARDDVEGMDGAIIAHPRTWEASGHVEHFSDPMVDCRACKKRFRADQLDEAAAQHGLLSEEVGLGLLFERSGEHARTGTPDTGRIGHGERVGTPRCILMDREEGGHTAAFLICFPHTMPWALGSDHGDVDVLRWLDRAVSDVEAVRKHQHVARLQVRLDVLLVDGWLRGVGRKNHDDVRLFDRVTDRSDRKTRRLRLGLALAAFLQTHANVYAALLQVERMRVALAAVADDRYFLASDQREVGVLVITNLGHVSLYSPTRGYAAELREAGTVGWARPCFSTPRVIATAPV